MEDEPNKGARSTVQVPSADYRCSQEEKWVYDRTAILLRDAIGKIGEDMAWSMILSRLARELRRKGGVEFGRSVFQGVADTMAEAAKYDAP